MGMTTTTTVASLKQAVAATLLPRKLLLLLDLKYGSISGFGVDIYLETMNRYLIIHRIRFHSTGKQSGPYLDIWIHFQTMDIIWDGAG